jgi:hypothetical protein
MGEPQTAAEIRPALDSKIKQQSESKTPPHLRKHILYLIASCSRERDWGNALPPKIPSFASSLLEGETVQGGNHTPEIHPLLHRFLK